MSDLFDPQSGTLTGNHVRLEPLALTHAQDLLVAGEDLAVWRHMLCAPPTTIEAMRGYIEGALKDAEGGGQIPFATVLIESGKAIGSTRYLEILRNDGGLEIGWTWIGKPWQRTAANTECKYLLMRHAFEDLGALRVMLKTDGRNEKSQKAIARIGGKREGVLRRNRRIWDGFVRDTVVYSILDSEWPEAKAALEARLSAGS
jgi:RimJ/RimL family protein N-acetyltransferase